MKIYKYIISYKSKMQIRNLKKKKTTGAQINF